MDEDFGEEYYEYDMGEDGYQEAEYQEDEYYEGEEDEYVDNANEEGYYDENGEYCVTEEQVEPEDTGYYDDEGNYIEYTNEDEEYAGYYDEDGNYVENTNDENYAAEEDAGYYDEDGNYVEYANDGEEYVEEGEEYIEEGEEYIEEGEEYVEEEDLNDDYWGYEGEEPQYDDEEGEYGEERPFKLYGATEESSVTEKYEAVREALLDHLFASLEIGGEYDILSLNVALCNTHVMACMDKLPYIEQYGEAVTKQLKKLERTNVDPELYTKYQTSEEYYVKKAAEFKEKLIPLKDRFQNMCMSSEGEEIVDHVLAEFDRSGEVEQSIEIWWDVGTTKIAEIMEKQKQESDLVRTFIEGMLRDVESNDEAVRKIYNYVKDLADKHQEAIDDVRYAEMHRIEAEKIAKRQEIVNAREREHLKKLQEAREARRLEIRRQNEEMIAKQAIADAERQEKLRILREEAAREFAIEEEKRQKEIQLQIKLFKQGQAIDEYYRKLIIWEREEAARKERERIAAIEAERLRLIELEKQRIAAEKERQRLIFEQQERARKAAIEAKRQAALEAKRKEQERFREEQRRAAEAERIRLANEAAEAARKAAEAEQTRLANEAAAAAKATRQAVEAARNEEERLEQERLAAIEAEKQRVAAAERKRIEEQRRKQADERRLAELDQQRQRQEAERKRIEKEREERKAEAVRQEEERLRREYDIKQRQAKINECKNRLTQTGIPNDEINELLERFSAEKPFNEDEMYKDVMQAVATEAQGGALARQQMQDAGIDVDLGYTPIGFAKSTVKTIPKNPTPRIVNRGSKYTQELSKRQMAHNWKSDIGWKRISEIDSLNDSVLWNGSGPDPLDFEQGSMGDCYLISSMNALCADPEYRPFLMDALVEMDRPNGYYKFRFFDKEENITYVEIDDYIPVKDGDKIVCCEPHNNCIFAVLLEKAFAVLRGGYGAIGHGGTSTDAFVTICGGEADFCTTFEEFKGTERQRFYKAKAIFDRGVMCCSDSDKTTLADDQGLITQHLYAVLDMKEVGGRFFVKVHNPWRGTEINAANNRYADENLPADVRQAFSHQTANDGTFIMSWSDFDIQFGDISYGWPLFQYTHRASVSGKITMQDNFISKTISTAPKWEIHASKPANFKVFVQVKNQSANWKVTPCYLQHLPRKDEFYIPKTWSTNLIDYAATNSSSMRSNPLNFRLDFDGFRFFVSFLSWLDDEPVYCDYTIHVVGETDFCLFRVR
ncbi:hypothetical protein PCE1_003221 [Barthelona sp. PCE]